MAVKGPIVTLLAGALFAGVIAAANVNAVRENLRPYQKAAAVGTPSPSASAPAAPSLTPNPTATATPVAIKRATFAGHTTAGDGTRASIAIVIRDGTAIAYLCSGRIESWLHGTAKDGVLALAGTHGATLTGAYTDQGATGRAQVAGRTFPITISRVTKPSGLWKAAAEVRGATVLAGWIVLPDGSQVGMVDVGGTETTAPPLDTAAPTATVDGATITAAPVDGDTGNGF